MTIREMNIDDHAAAVALWREVGGIHVSDSDRPAVLHRYLARNPGLSAVAVDGDEIVGAVLCGHDGRGGMIRHLGVKSGSRGRGVGSALVEWCIEGLREQGIQTCATMVFSGNDAGMSFWRGRGWYAGECAALYKIIDEDWS